MKTFLPSKFSKIVKITIISLLFLQVKLNFEIKEISTPNLNENKNISFKKIYNKVEIEQAISSDNETLNLSREVQEEKEDINNTVIETFIGEITGYGPDCKNCLGKVACSPYQDVREGNIYYNDDEDYKNLRIVAADRSIPCGTIVKIKGLKNGGIPEGESIIAIVLDRGSAIKDNIFDLLFETEEQAFPVGRQNVEVDILRWGNKK
jgi:3D (Asp-Asp-Asp) domain-containing protein